MIRVYTAQGKENINSIIWETLLIFVAANTHTSDKCPINNPDRIRYLQKVLSEEEAGKNNCKLINFLVSPTEHVGYIILEADSHESMMRFMRSLMSLGETKIAPVDHWKNFSAQLQNRVAIATKRWG
jgi:hypothetical protein